MLNNKSANLSLGFLLLFLFSSILSANNSCVVLQYHHFSKTTPNSTSVTPDQFQQHLDYLKKNDFAVTPLDVVLDAMTAGYELPDRCVTITVDDAYKSVFTEAFPRLQKYGWSMTVFVNTAAIDKKRKPYMSWKQIKVLSQKGVKFENHSHSHGHLIRKLKNENNDDWEQRVSSDILLAQDRLTEHTGRAPLFFAYPYGEYNDNLRQLVRSLGLMSFGQQSGPIWSGGDLYSMPRFPMAANYAAMPSFITKVNSLAMPIISIAPSNPVVDLDEWQPELTLQFHANQYQKNAINCFANGSNEVDKTWSKTDKDTLVVKMRKKLHVGRNRYNCTMSSRFKGRFHWYSQNWIRPKSDGSWYTE